MEGVELRRRRWFCMGRTVLAGREVWCCAFRRQSTVFTKHHRGCPW